MLLTMCAWSLALLAPGSGSAGVVTFSGSVSTNIYDWTGTIASCADAVGPISGPIISADLTCDTFGDFPRATASLVADLNPLHGSISAFLWTGSPRSGDAGSFPPNTQVAEAGFALGATITGLMYLAAPGRTGTALVSFNDNRGQCEVISLSGNIPLNEVVPYQLEFASFRSEGSESYAAYDVCYDLRNATITDPQSGQVLTDVQLLFTPEPQTLSLGLCGCLFTLLLYRKRQ
jgi:hypothetical protein